MPVPFLSEYKEWIFFGDNEINADDSFVGELRQLHENGALHISGAFSLPGVPSGQFCCFDKCGFLSLLIIFSCDGTINVKYAFDLEWYIGSVCGVNYGTRSSPFAHEKTYYNGMLANLSLRTTSEFQLNQAIANGMPLTPQALETAKKYREFVRASPSTAIVDDTPNTIIDLPGDSPRSIPINRCFPTIFGGLGPTIDSDPIPEDYEGIAVKEREDGSVDYRGRWLPGKEPIAQHLFFWPNGNVKEFSYWCFGRLIGIRASFYPNGNLHKEEHYGPNGSIDGTGIIVEYTQSGELHSIRKLVAQQPVEDIIDPQTNYPFYVVRDEPT